jgi:RimJ/RimL family protein N-acetyltransferase
MHAITSGFYWFLAKLLAPWQFATLAFSAKATSDGHDGFVPVRELHVQDRHDVLTHLLALNGADRYLRFGYSAQDAQIEQYVATLNFGRDRVFGIYNRKLCLIAMAHLAYIHDPQAASCAEFGVSVLPAWRGRGFGTELFARAVLHARNDRISLMFIHALSENTAMLHIAQRAGATVERLGSESEAYLTLPSPTLQSHWHEAVDVQIAATDYQLKSQARHFWALLESFQEMRKSMREAPDRSPF